MSADLGHKAITTAATTTTTTSSPAAILERRRIPHLPGVYLMKDSQSNIIYIGKAKDLRKRVASYFVRHLNEMGWKTSRLVSRISDIDYVVTENEIEAYLLESNLIKRYRPQFNIELKDQQRYTYLKVTNEPFPRLLVARRNRSGEFTGPAGSVYGPFVRGSSKFLTVGLLRKLFKIRTCDRLPKTPCLQYFIKNCEAPCIAKVTQADYLAKVSALKKMLEGKTTIEKFSQSLREEMLRASDFGDYEHAKEIRDTIYRLDNLLVRQRMEKATTRNPDEEYIGIMSDNRKGVGYVMTIRRTRGVISDRKKFQFDLVGDNSLSSFILQYYSSQPAIPSRIYVSEAPESKSILESSLAAMADHRVNISVIKEELGATISSGRSRIMELIMSNLRGYIQEGYHRGVVELKEYLNLKTMPDAIDCFDVSNLGTSIAVGACSRFANGAPDKSMYRKFRIGSVMGQNDVAMIGEIISRRYSEGMYSSSLPDLVVIDGGKSQLSAAKASLRRLGLERIPCISLAKENEEIYLAELSDPLLLPRRSPALKMLQHLRDEAHRFSINYNKQLRRLAGR